MKSYFIKTPWLAYNTVWRWHFYAGLFCLPFIVLLAITGAIYLFKPQFEAYQESAYQVKINGKVAQSVTAQVLAAAKSLPHAQFSAYQLPAGPQSPAHVMLVYQGELRRVLVNPYTLQVMNVSTEEDRFMPWIHRLHGRLLIGDKGSYLVELAASWAIVMMVTGLFLWWPREAKGWAGVLYPRLRIANSHQTSGKVAQRIFWRDLHAVIGFWIAFFVLFLLISGLPWTKSWGGLLKEVRQLGVTSQIQIKQDWFTSQKEVRDANAVLAPGDEHAHHQHDQSVMVQPAEQMALPASLDTMASNVSGLQLPPPVIIAAPSKRNAGWVGKSDTQHRPSRVTVDLDPQSGAILSRTNFEDKTMLDRVIGYGVAVHEGQLFGWFNQLLGLISALGLVTLVVSGVVMWLRRRQASTLGAPFTQTRQNTRMPIWTIVAMVLLAMLLPFLGLSLIAVLMIERLVLVRLPKVAGFLGLSARTS
jgi:uncharacterized iron-regulated membrane protein